MKQKEVDERVELDDGMILAIIEKMIKQRKDSIQQFEAGGRPDLADIEKAEIAVLLPICQQLCLMKKQAVAALLLPRLVLQVRRICVKSSNY
jgi:uncharacterized protein YqeY